MNYHENLRQAAIENNHLAIEFLNARNMRNAVFMVAYEYAKYVDGESVYDDNGKRDDFVIYDSFAKVACIDAHALEALCCLGKIERDDFACLCFYGLDISFKSELVQGWFERYIVDDIIIINPEDEDYKVIEIQLNKEA